MLAALSRKHIAMTGRLGSGPALGPEYSRFMRCGFRFTAPFQFMWEATVAAAIDQA